MREAEFKAWLEDEGYSPGTINTQMSKVRKLDRVFGDLDGLYAVGGFDRLEAQLKTGDNLPASIGNDGERGHLPTSLRYYRKFIEGDRRSHTSQGSGRDRFADEIRRLMRVFRDRMPDFSTFAEEQGTFWETEAAYKKEARARVMAAVSDPALSDEERGREIYKALGQGTAPGLPLSWRTLGEVSKTDGNIQQRFFKTIARIARLTAGDQQGLLECARELEALREAGISGLRRGEVLGIGISVYGTVNTDDACWFKARTFDQLGRALLGHKLFGSPRFEIADFEEFQSVMNRIRAQLDEAGWQTGSLTDVQGFIWVAMAEEWGETGVADLTREAVELAMDECQEIGVDAFLAKYQFGKPRDYWVRRKGDQMLYPAKATVGAAYGFMPGGTAQTAKQFYGGFGEQAANGILQRLGFEIVSGRGDKMTELREPAAAPLPSPTNLILYGPPGTGKTYATATEAVRLCESLADDDPLLTDTTRRAELRERYKRLVDAGQVRLVTFHQSYSYEDFVEGLRPVTDAPAEEEQGSQSAGFRLEPKRGIVREICSVAENARKNSGRSGTFDLTGRKLFKMSLGRVGVDDHIFDAAIDGDYAVLGWGGDVDWTDARSDQWSAILERWQQENPEATGNDPNVVQMWPFRSAMKEGDLIIVSAGNSHFRAIGEVKGPYRFEPTDTREYNHRRPVDWLLVPDEPLPTEMIYGKKFMMQSCYQLKDALVNKEALSRLLGATSGGGDGDPDQFVLIIDEINRANISKVFGELITLIEPDKRLGAGSEALTVRLPYSGETFGVPANLHIVGTMNTADRSIASLDIALRRRFVFREIEPDPSILPEDVQGVPLRRVLKVINDRIEYLIDREHRIGHAFFLGGDSCANIDAVMRDKVIPLLQEYFFEDWGRIAAVLGEPTGKGGGFLDCRKLKDPTGRDGEERESWSVRKVFSADAYDRLVGNPQAIVPQQSFDEAAE
jgi:hypothetical protein